MVLLSVRWLVYLDKDEKSQSSSDEDEELKDLNCCQRMCACGKTRRSRKSKKNAVAAGKQFASVIKDGRVHFVDTVDLEQKPVIELDELNALHERHAPIAD